MSAVQPPIQTAIHRMVAQCRAGSFEAAVGQCDSGWVIMGERQIFTGYCLLLPDPVVPHLNALADAERMRFMRDMTGLGDALLEVCSALRINYAVFGNLEPAAARACISTLRKRTRGDALRPTLGLGLERRAGIFGRVERGLEAAACGQDGT